MSPSLTYDEISTMPLPLMNELITYVPKLEKNMHKLNALQLIVDILLTVFSKDGKGRKHKEDISFEDLVDAPESHRKEVFDKIMSRYRGAGRTKVFDPATYMVQRGSGFKKGGHSNDGSNTNENM